MAPNIERTFDITPVDIMSRSIVKIGESTEGADTTMNLRATHKITFRAIWTEICQQQMVLPYYLSVTEWRQQLDTRLKINPHLLYGLSLFSSMLTDDFTQETKTTGDNESDLSLPTFVKALLQNRVDN